LLASTVREAPPAFFTHPDLGDSIGDDVADWVGTLQLGNGDFFVPDDNQRALLRAMFAGPPGVSYQTRDRKWFSSQVAVVAPRQNLKTATLEMGVAAALWLLDARLVVWTAHLYNPAAAESFLHFKELIDCNPHLSRGVKRVLEASGGQGIELMNRARIKFQARSKNAGRSLSGDLIVMDEAYALSTAEAGALIPTRSARPNSQIWYGSSAGHLDSEQLRLIRDRGRVGARRQTYAEWCSTAQCESDRCTHELGEPGCVLDDQVEWAKANPALGTRIDVDTIADERASMSPAEFARERLGWWDEPSAGHVIPGPKWAACASEGVVVGSVGLFVDIALDRSVSVVAVCGADADGIPQVEIAEMSPGTDWVTDRVSQMLGRHEVLAVGARSAGPVASLLPELKGVCAEAEVDFVKVGSSDFAGMCGAFFDAVYASGLRHRSDPRVDAALTAARRHQVLDAWTWERTKVDVDAAPLVAVTGALALFVQRRNDTAVDPLNNIW
jgi:hypothetical protein